MEISFGRNKRVEIYKPFGNTRILHYHFKQTRKGCWIYLPSEVLGRLGVDQSKDGDFIAFILDDLDDKYPFLAITKEDFITSKLRPVLFDLRQQATASLERLKEAVKASELDVYTKGDTNANF